MPGPKGLPVRPDLDWYKKAAKKRLEKLRILDAAAKLADAQHALAREHGFASWRGLKDRIDELTNLSKLFGAIRDDDRATMSALLAKTPGLLKLTGSEGQTAIHVAVECNNPCAVEILLGKRADPEVCVGASGHNALSWALTVGATLSAEALVRGGIEPDFFCAAGMGDVERVRSFFDPRGKLRPKASRTGSSRWAEGKRLPVPPTTSRERISDALYLASRNGHSTVVRELLTHAPDLSFRAFLGGTALHWAYYSGQLEVVKLLIQAGADPRARDQEYNATPRAFGICVAASWGFPGIFDRVLHMDPSIVNIQEGRGTPLHEAARAGNIAIVRALLSSGADPSLRDAEDRTPLEFARSEHFNDIVRILEPITKRN